jgi:glycosyltransferase involved in cell wall biosynthesis
MIERRVSAVITAYNSEAFIAEAIESVLRQSRAVDEIVVVDDGSTDHTRRIVEEYADQGIKFIQQHNRGAGAARNKGICETSGEYIAFLDADDIWLENKTRLQVDYLNKHPKAGLVSGFAHWWNMAKDRVRVTGKVPRDMRMLQRLSPGRNRTVSRRYPLGPGLGAVDAAGEEVRCRCGAGAGHDLPLAPRKPVAHSTLGAAVELLARLPDRHSPKQTGLAPSVVVGSFVEQLYLPPGDVCDPVCLPALAAYLVCGAGLPCLSVREHA